MDAPFNLRTIVITIVTACFSSFLHAGYFGASQSFNTTASFDQQDDGFRVDFGSNATDWLDLEWSYIDYGNSAYDDPNFVLGDPDDEDDEDRFENTGYGTQRVNEQTASYSGISYLRAQGIGAGLKFKKQVNNWMQLYGRISFLAWQADSTNVTIFAPRPAYDSDGNALADPNDVTNANNLNDCGTLSYCRIESSEKEQTWAVDFWYGYGALFKPFSWLAIRTEYSIVTLNAVEFPKGTLEGFSAGLEIHF